MSRFDLGWRLRANLAAAVVCLVILRAVDFAAQSCERLVDRGHGLHAGSVGVQHVERLSLGIPCAEPYGSVARDFYFRHGCALRTRVVGELMSPLVKSDQGRIEIHAARRIVEI